MCIFKSAKRQEKKQKLNIECEAFFDRINAAIDEANDFFAEDEYIDVSTADWWLNKHASLFREVDREFQSFRKADLYGKLLNNIKFYMT